jgi:hypothetical protein
VSAHPSRVQPKGPSSSPTGEETLWNFLVLFYFLFREGEIESGRRRIGPLGDDTYISTRYVYVNINRTRRRKRS